VISLPRGQEEEEKRGRDERDPSSEPENTGTTIQKHEEKIQMGRKKKRGGASRPEQPIPLKDLKTNKKTREFRRANSRGGFRKKNNLGLGGKKDKENRKPTRV